MKKYETERKRLENIDDQTPEEWAATKRHEERLAATKRRWEIYEEVKAARTEKFELMIKGYLKQPALVKIKSKHDPQDIKRTVFVQSERHPHRWFMIMEQGLKLDAPTYFRKHWDSPLSQSDSEGDLPEYS